MTTFETLEKDETGYGNNNFLQVARKVAKDDHGSTEFLAVTRGYISGQGARRYKTNMTLPTDPDLVEWVAQHLQRHADNLRAEQAAETATETATA